MCGVSTQIEYPMDGVNSRRKYAQIIGGIFMENYGERLRAARTMKKLTQTELAERLGITQKSYQRMETGNHDLKMSTICKICKTLDISADWLIGLSTSMNREVNLYDLIGNKPIITTKPSKEEKKTG